MGLESGAIQMLQDVQQRDFGATYTQAGRDEEQPIHVSAWDGRAVAMRPPCPCALLASV
jgi:hypothetical protein